MLNSNNVFKKFVLLTVVFAVFTVLGCGGGGGGNNSDDNSTTNAAPTADAGNDQTVNEGGNVALDGGNSSDSDGSIASYSWTQTAGPAVTLANADTATPSFTAPSVAADTVLTFELTVTDDDGATDSDSVDVMVQKVNVPPTADAGPDQLNVEELTLVNLDGSNSSDSDGSIASYNWTQTAGPAVTLTDADTATPSFTAPEVVDATMLAFQLEVTDNDGGTGVDEVQVQVVNVGFLSGTLEASPVRVNLTGEGTLDWAHWGRLVNNDFDHNNDVTQQISNVTLVGNPVNPNGPFRFDDAPIAYSWSNGTPDPDEVDSTTGVFFSMPNADDSDLGKGYSLTVPAETTSKTLKLYLGAFQGQGRLVATLSDGSAAPYQVFVASPDAVDGSITKVVTVTFKAQTAGQSLNIQFTLNDDFGSSSNLTLQAASLTAVATPTISPAGGQFTDSVEITLETATPGAQIRYTQDGTEPNASSLLYTSPFTLTSDPNLQVVRAKAFINGVESAIATGSFTVNGTVSGGSLSATVSLPPTSVDLTSEGTLDWAHWGRLVNNDFDHNNDVTQQISNVTLVGNPVNPNGPFQFGDAPVAYSWSNGTPDPDEVDTTTGVFFSMPNADDSDLGKGYSLTVPADTTPKTLKLYLGGLRAEGRLVVSLDDGSADPVEVFVSHDFSAITRVVTITFKAQGSTTLNVEYTLTDDFDSTSNLTLQSATLN